MQWGRAGLFPCLPIVWMAILLPSITTLTSHSRLPTPFNFSILLTDASKLPKKYNLEEASKYRTPRRGTLWKRTGKKDKFVPSYLFNFGRAAKLLTFCNFYHAVFHSQPDTDILESFLLSRNSVCCFPQNMKHCKLHSQKREG